MLLGRRHPTHYEISITPVTPHRARRPSWLGALITLLVLAVAALIGQRDDSGNTTPRPERTQITDVRTDTQEARP
ncbi:hypothetical protein ACFWY6_43000 [Streptomyces sp. NPDC059037]|uniref:hypothetical protein n=1 Tax=Streptomyces sp. NPDC059037 TaxID=3346710 RepID=UPI0036B93ED6